MHRIINTNHLKMMLTESYKQHQMNFKRQLLLEIVTNHELQLQYLKTARIKVRLGNESFRSCKVEFVSGFIPSFQQAWHPCR